MSTSMGIKEKVFGKTLHVRTILLLTFSLCLLLVLITAVKCSADNQLTSTSPRVKDVLVGANYWGGWWNGKDGGWFIDKDHPEGWRPKYPERVSLLGLYNDQQYMDREIAAAADHGVDFFSLLWYPPSEQGIATYSIDNVRSSGPTNPLLTRGMLQNRSLSYFISSSNAHRMKFMIDFCNEPDFAVTTDADWEECIETWVLAMRHPSYLRVGGRLVFDVYSIDLFFEQNGNDVERCRQLLDRLRQAVREAGLGEMLIGGGSGSSQATQLFDFSGNYFNWPEVETPGKEYPYRNLSQNIQEVRLSHVNDPIPWMPYLAGGANARPWSENGMEEYQAFFTFPTRNEWEAELRGLARDFEKYPKLGLPLPNGQRQKAFTIFAWNEFGEGGIVAPTKGDGYMKLEAIDKVFGHVPYEDRRNDFTTPFSSRVSSAASFREGSSEFAGRFRQTGRRVAGMGLNSSATPHDGPGRVPQYSFSGIVPDGVDHAVVGFRINTESDGPPGASDFLLYGVRYIEGSNVINRLPRDEDLSDSNNVRLVPSDRGTGKALHVRATPEEQVNFDLPSFPVTPGAPYTVTFISRVSPMSVGSSYFSIIFLSGKEGSEVARKTIPL